MFEYILNFFVYTAAMIGLIYLVFIYLKANPQLRGMAQVKQPKGPPLQVESVMDLEPRKRLYVVSYGSQRFLLSTTVDKTEMLTTLKEEPVEVEQVEPIVEGAIEGAVACQEDTGLMERFQASLKMVLADRFPGTGGK